MGLRQIDPAGKSLLIFRNRVKPRNQKYFCFRPTQISSLIRAGPSHKRGGSRSSRTRGGMRWTLAARETSAACWRTAKSCRSDAPMLASSLREEAQATVSNKPGHRGEREVSRKTIARGMPGLFRCDRGDYARVLCFISHARLRVHWAPGIPCALYDGGTLSCKTSGESRRVNANSHPLGCLKIKSGKLNEAVAALTLPWRG